MALGSNSKHRTARATDDSVSDGPHLSVAEGRSRIYTHDYQFGMRLLGDVQYLLCWIAIPDKQRSPICQKPGSVSNITETEFCGVGPLPVQFRLSCWALQDVLQGKPSLMVT